jgi:antitoxin Phd
MNLSYFSYYIVHKETAMTINKNNMVSINEANQNFSRVVRMVDKTRVAVIFKNNVPRYIVLDFSQIKEEEATSTNDALDYAKKLLKKHLPAFQKLAE